MNIKLSVKTVPWNVLFQVAPLIYMAMWTALDDKSSCWRVRRVLSRAIRRIEQSKIQHQYFFHFDLKLELNELIFKATLMSRENNRNDKWVPSYALSTQIFQSSLRKEKTSLWYGRQWVVWTLTFWVYRKMDGFCETVSSSQDGEC